MAPSSRDARQLREGFTTGTAAAAAAKAAALLLLTGERARSMDTPLPPGGRLTVPIDHVDFERNPAGAPTPPAGPHHGAARPTTPSACARARVVKDGGDDPDATHGHAIEALVALFPPQPAPSIDAPEETHSPGEPFPARSKQAVSAPDGHVPTPTPAESLAPGIPCAQSSGGPARVSLFGGRGVGLVTLPGLPVPPGEPAINPDPRRQIIAAVMEALNQAGSPDSATVTVEVPEGEAIAAKTMNPRLGITGGISILGTRGTVKPFSHESYAASIRQALDVARAQGVSHVALTTGGRTEGLVRADMPGLPALACVQFADFFALSLREAAARGFAALTVGCYFGKLVKMAQGFEYTHAKDTRIDFGLLARWFAEAGIDPALAARVASANTARHALEIAWDDPAKHAMVDAVTGKALATARTFAGPGPAIDYRVYAFDGAPLIHRKGD